MKEKNTIRDIRNAYLPQPVRKTDELRALDRSVKRPVQILAYAAGAVGALTLGLGMSLAMGVIGESAGLGIAVGCVGIAVTSLNHLLYTKLLARRREKYKDAVLALCDEASAQTV